MFHVEKLTPEWSLGLRDGHEKVQIEKEDLEDVESGWNTSEEPDLVAIGCPHCSVGELRKLAKMLEKGWSGPELWACTSEAVSKQVPDAVDIIKSAGRPLRGRQRPLRRGPHA